MEKRIKNNNKNEKKFKFLIVSLIVLFVFSLFYISLINAEMDMFQTINIDEDDSTTIHHTILTFDDTSSSFIGFEKSIPIEVHYIIEALPYNLTGYGGEVDWCNLTIIHNKNEYSGGEFVNSTEDIESYYYSASGFVSTFIEKRMYGRDVLIASMKCHYTNASTLFVENTLIGRTYIIAPSYECDECEDYTLEELSNELERQDAIIQKETLIHRVLFLIVELNFQIWNIIGWIVKIGFVLIGISLIFYSIYSIYIFLMDLSRRIK